MKTANGEVAVIIALGDRGLQLSANIIVEMSSARAFESHSRTRSD